MEDDLGTVYNVEIQTTRKKNLPKRIRYYQGMIDLNIIDKGKNYSDLKKSFVIFIATYDPFGRGRYVYTFRNRCEEEDGLYLEDGTTKIILNAAGRKGEITQELKETLDYMAGKVPEGDYAKKLDSAVQEVKKSEKWRREYMTLFMRDKEQQRYGSLITQIASVRDSRGSVSDDLLKKILMLDEGRFDRIVFYLNNNPEWDNEEVADAILEEED